MKRKLTNHLLIPAAVILLFAFGDTNQNSFSQEMKRKQDVPAMATKVFSEPRRYRVDTNYLNRILMLKIDSLKREHDITRQENEAGKKVIGVQKVNQSNLEKSSSSLKRSLELAEDEEFDLPPIELIYAKKKPSPLDVTIEYPLNPDTLVVPRKKKGIFQLLKFWK